MAPSQKSRRPVQQVPPKYLQNIIINIIGSFAPESDVATFIPAWRTMHDMHRTKAGVTAAGSHFYLTSVCSTTSAEPGLVPDCEYHRRCCTSRPPAVLELRQLQTWQCSIKNTHLKKFKYFYDKKITVTPKLLWLVLWKLSLYFTMVAMLRISCDFQWAIAISLI